MQHGRHIYAKLYDMEKATMCAYPQSDHAFPLCKCVFRCCAKCSSLNLPDQEIDYQYSNTSLSICFRVYPIIARCVAHGILPLNNKKFCRMCRQDYVSEQCTKQYTRKELVMMETIIYDFRTSFYISSIQ